MRAAAAMLVVAATATGCMGPSDSRGDLDRVANEILDVAEASLPVIAESLDATLAKVFSDAVREGGSEDSTPRVTFRVEAWMTGPAPTQADLEQALVDAGFTIVATPDGAPSSDGPWADATSADGAIILRTSYGSTDNMGVDVPNPAINFYISHPDPLRVSNDTFNDFDRDFPREFDPSLVSAGVGTSDLGEQATAFLDGAESDLVALANGLRAKLSSAEFMVVDDDSDPATAAVVFAVDAVMSGPTATQESLEKALIAAGYPDVVSRDDPNPPEFPYARTVSADGTSAIDVHFSAPVGEDGAIEVYLRSVASMSATDAEVKTFRDTFERGFDQSLLSQ